MEDQVTYKFKTKLAEGIDHTSSQLSQLQASVFEGYQPEIMQTNNMNSSNILGVSSSYSSGSGGRANGNSQLKGSTGATTQALLQSDNNLQGQVDSFSQNAYENCMNDYQPEDFRWEIEKRYQQSEANRNFYFPRVTDAKRAPSESQLSSSRNSSNESLLSVDCVFVYNLHEQNMKNYQREYMEIYEDQDEKTHKIRMEEVLKIQQQEQNLIEEQRKQYFEKQQRLITQQVIVQHQHEKAQRQTTLQSNPGTVQPQQQYGAEVIQTEPATRVNKINQKEVINSRQSAVQDQTVDRSKRERDQASQQQGVVNGTRRMKTEGNDSWNYQKQHSINTQENDRRKQINTQGYYDQQESDDETIENFEEALQDGSDSDNQDIARLDQLSDQKKVCRTSISPSVKANNYRLIVKNTPSIPIRGQQSQGNAAPRTAANSDLSSLKNYKQLMDILEKAQKTREASSTSGVKNVNGPVQQKKDIKGVGNINSSYLKNGPASMHKTTQQRPSSSLNSHSGRQGQATTTAISVNKQIMRGVEKPSLASAGSAQRKGTSSKEGHFSQDIGHSLTQQSLMDTINSRKRSSSGRQANSVHQKAISVSVSNANQNYLLKQYENQRPDKMKSSIHREDKYPHQPSTTNYQIRSSQSGGYLNVSSKLATSSTTAQNTISVNSNNSKIGQKIRTPSTSNHQNGSISSSIHVSSSSSNNQGNHLPIRNQIISSNSKKQLLSNSSSSKLIPNQQNYLVQIKQNPQGQYQINDNEQNKSRVQTQQIVYAASSSIPPSRLSTEVDREIERNPPFTSLSKIPSNHNLNGKNNSVTRKDQNNSASKMSLRDQLLSQSKSSGSQKYGVVTGHSNSMIVGGQSTSISRTITETNDTYGPSVIDQNIHNGQIEKIREYLKQQQQQQSSSQGKPYLHNQKTLGKQISVGYSKNQVFPQDSHSPHSDHISRPINQQAQQHSGHTQLQFQKQMRQ